MPSPSLDDLVAACLDLIESEGLGAVDGFCARHPAHAGAIRERLAQLDQFGLLRAEEVDTSEAIPERLGEFRLLRRLGAGGMGIVYLAEQESLHREVALKLVRPEHLYFPGARERFRREVEAVARLRHPGIVPVFTVGDDGGIPYYAMEFIDGVTLQHVLDRLVSRPPAELSARDLRDALDPTGPDTPAPSDGSWVVAVVRLVLQVAEALVHAHDRGVLHRDVKPSNVMVSPDGTVRVVDFGLASTEGSTRLTKSGSAMGSLLYMAPEQVRGDTDRIDARTDVYALGVVLYELLTLAAPFHDPSADAVRRLVLDADPTPVRSRNASVPWDVETVCHCAMDGDPARRYPTMAAFADDLRRILALEPIAARRPSAGLRARRWVQRHPTRAVALLLGGLLIGPGSLAFGWTTWRKNREIERQMARTVEAKDEAEAIWRFQRRLLSSVDPGEDGRNVRMADVLDAASTEIGGRFDGRPGVEARVRGTIGESYHALGLLDAAAPHVEAAVARALEARGEGSQEVLEARARLGRLRIDQGRLDDAEALLAPTVEALRALGDEAGAAVFSATNTLASLRREQGRLDEAEALSLTAADGLEEALGEAHEESLRALGSYGAILYVRGELARAEEVMRRVVALREEHQPPTHPDALISTLNLANVLYTRGETDEAIALVEDVLETQRHVLGDDHANVLTTQSALATYLTQARRYAEVEPLERALIEARTRKLGADHPDTLRSRGNLVDTVYRLERLAEAEELAHGVLADRRRVLGPTHWETLSSCSQLGVMMASQGRDADGEPFLAEAATGARDSLGPEHWVTGVFTYNHGHCLVKLGRCEEAEPVLLEAHRVLVAALGADHERTKKCVGYLVELYEAWGKPEEAGRWREA